jgi:PAS domain S-box-containing protein
VEDNPSDVELVVLSLQKGGFEVSADVAQTAEEFTSRIRTGNYNLILADYSLPQWSGMEALDILCRENLDVPLIVVTGYLGEEKAVECIKQGATDCVLKDHLARLPLSVSRALEEKAVRERQKRSDATLRESQAQLEALVQSAMDAILTVDEEQNIVMFNVAAEKMFRCSRKAAVGQPIERFIPQRFRALHCTHVRTFAETGATKRVMESPGVLSALRADGEEFHMEASISHAKIGARTLFTVIIRDITEREQVKEKLATKVQELTRSNAELEQFAYVASHDLQEPLRMIANYTQLLAERYRGKLDEQADKYIHYAVDGATRMQTLIQDLLKFSRVGRAELQPRTTECGAVVEQAVNNLRAAVQESGAVVSWSGLPMVMADASQLTQVFQNLIANAIKFHGAEVPRIEINAEKKDHEWVITVSDNGIGIPAESWSDIFVIFRRLHTRDEYAGNGIGLSICKKIVERHGGRIWIEAQSKPGCCFKFTLPLEVPKAAQAAHA